MNRVFLLLLLQVNLICVSQNPIYEIDFSKNKDIIDVLPVFKENKNILSLLILKHDTLKTILFDSLHNIQNLYSVEINNPNVFEKLVDITNFDSLVYVVYKNKSTYSSNYGFFSIDYLKGILTEKELNLNKDREEFIISHSHNESFYILTIKINSSYLFLYRFNKKGELLSKNLIDLSQFNEKVNLYSFIKNTNPGDYSVDVSRINESNKEILNPYSSKSKTYARNEKLFLLIGNQNRITYLYNIDLPSATFEVKKFTFPELLCKPYKFHIHNSLIIDSLLFQFYACSKELSLTISSIVNTNKYASYKCTPDELNEFHQGMKVYYEFKDLKIENIDSKDIKTFLKGFLENDLYVSINDDNNESYSFSIGILDKENIVFPILFYPSYVFMFSYQQLKPISIYYALDKQNLTITRYNSISFNKVGETLNNQNLENQFILHGYTFRYDKKNKKLKLYHK